MIRVVDAGGDAHARGVAIGLALRDRIAAHMADWLATMGRAAGGDGEGYARRLLRDTDFRDALALHAPDLLDEARGVAEGASQDPDLVYALQLMDEEWAYRVRTRRTAAVLQKCSSLAIVTAGGPTWIGQNMDLGPHTDTHQVALRIGSDGDRPAALLFSIAGMLALMGVNGAGVGVCVNSLPQLPSAPTGVPVAFMIRRLLQARSLAETVDLVRSLPHATNQHYVLAAPGAVRSFECSAAGVTEYRPADRSRVLHTNHPLGAETGTPEPQGERRNSVARLESLTRRLGEGQADLASLQGALCAFDDPQNPVCRVYDPAAGLIGFTTGSMLTALRPGPKSLRAWMSAGPPSVAGYDPVSLAERT